MNSELSNRIKAEALSLGFSACGIARAEAVSPDVAEGFTAWLSNGGHATMAYMENHLEKRLDPRLLVPGTKSIVSVALNYAPAQRLPEGEYQIAAYALGQDYHDVRAGLGWIGRNHQLIIPRAGSMFFLGEVFLPIELDYDTPMESLCGNCHRCIEACPTGALATKEQSSPSEGNEGGVFISSRCLSYQTIENRGDIPDDIAEAMGDTIYGCDRCQQTCPWNRFAQPTDEPLLQPKEELLSMTREQWQQLTEDDYRRLFKGSAVKRAKYEGLMRNINKVRS